MLWIFLCSKAQDSLGIKPVALAGVDQAITLKTKVAKLDSIFKMMQDSGWSTYSLGEPLRIDSMYNTDSTLIMFFNNENYVDSNVIKLLPQVEHLFDSVTVYGNEEPVYHRKRDTVPVILIVIDTSSRISLLMIITDPLSKAKSDGRLPFWIRGYSVREPHTIADCGNCGIYWENVSYLDENKIPLSKSIIVWDAKEINSHN